MANLIDRDTLFDTQLVLDLENTISRVIDDSNLYLLFKRHDCRDDMTALIKDLQAVGSGTKLCYVCLHKDKCSKCDECNFKWRGKK